MFDVPKMMSFCRPLSRCTSFYWTSSTRLDWKLQEELKEKAPHLVTKRDILSRTAQLFQVLLIGHDWIILDRCRFFGQHGNHLLSELPGWGCRAALPKEGSGMIDSPNFGMPFVSSSLLVQSGMAQTLATTKSGLLYVSGSKVKPNLPSRIWFPI